MKILLLKASDSNWYKIVECNSIEELCNFSDGEGIILVQNFYTLEELSYWEGMTKEDAAVIATLKYKAVIYDDYVE